MNKIEITNNEEYICINNPDYFLTFSDLKISDGIDITENIIILSDKILKKEYNDLELMEFIEKYQEENNIEGSYISTNLNKLKLFKNEYKDHTIINILNNDLKVKNYNDKLKITEYSDKYNCDIGQIILIDYALSPKLLIDIYKTSTKEKTKFFQKLQIPKHIENIINKNEFLVISCNLPEECFNEEYIMDNGVDISQMVYDDDKINKNQLIENIKKSIRTNCEKSLKKMKLNFGILDYLYAEGITVDTLVETGLELCVGVEKTKELKKKVKKEILKSLTDINVIALLMAAIRTEEDFQSQHLREVDVSDDPAYLYTDEVLGLAISNQIAGTKAQFNFVRYDMKKPGILSQLGPMLDDIIGGLIAGSMSKVFEEYKKRILG